MLCHLPHLFYIFTLSMLPILHCNQSCKKQGKWDSTHEKGTKGIEVKDIKMIAINAYRKCSINSMRFISEFI